MVLSVFGKFKVTIIKKSNSDNDVAYDEYYAPDRKCYIRINYNEEFIIRVEAMENFEDHYGCILYIDGREYKHTKIFKNKGHFLGFKLGHGNYKTFTFGKLDLDCIETISTTETANNTPLGVIGRENNLASDKSLTSHKLGNIYIRFFKTFPVKTNLKIKEPVKYQVIETVKSRDDKKLCHESAYIKEGSVYDAGTQMKWENNVYQKFKNRGYIIDHRIDITQFEDDVEINYSDFPSLLLKGILSLKNVHHLYMMPNNNYEYFLQALETIIHYNKNSISIEDLGKQFILYTKNNISNFTKNNNTLQFVLEQLPRRFFFKDGLISTVDRKEILSKLDFFEIDLYLTKKEKEFLSNKRKHKDCKTTCKLAKEKLMGKKGDVDVTSIIDNDCEIIEKNGLLYELNSDCYSNAVKQEYESKNIVKGSIIECINLIEDDD